MGLLVKCGILLLHTMTFPNLRLHIPADVNGNGKCTDFSKLKCSDFGNSNAPISVIRLHHLQR